MSAWILVANASEAYLYGSDNIRTKDIQLLKELTHPESREKGRDLISDRPGHYQTDHMTRSAYEKSDPKEVEAEVFARNLATELKVGLDSHNYEQLVIIASPHFYGLINKHIGFSLDKFTHIPKDYTKLTERELLVQIKKQLFGE